MKKLVTLISFCLLFFTSHAQFTSTQSGPWNDGATWGGSPGGVAGTDFPDNTADATVNHALSVNSNAACRNLTLGSGGEIFLFTGDLSINGPAVINNSTQPVTILSNAQELRFTYGTLTTVTLNEPLIIAGGSNTLFITPFTTVTLAGTDSLKTNGIVAVDDNGILNSNGKLVLRANSSISYGRIALNDGVAIGSRDVYGGNITGNITMEKKLGTTLLPSLPAVFDWRTGQNVSNGTWFQFCLPLVCNWDDVTGITINDNSHTPAYQRNIWRYVEQPRDTGTAGPIGGNNTGWAEGWQPVADHTTTSQDTAITLFLTSGAPYAADQTISVTGTADLTAHTYDLYFTRDPNGPVLNPPGTDQEEQHGWNYIRNPWPSIIETSTWLSDVSQGNLNTRLGTRYHGVHVWNSTAIDNDSTGTSQFSGHYEAWTTLASGNTLIISYNTSGGILFNNTGAGAERIPPFQGFWMKLDATTWESAGTPSGSPGIKTKTTGTIDPLYATADINGKNYQKTSGTTPDVFALIAYDVDSIRDITMVYYTPTATDNFDYDGDLYKLKSPLSNVPNLWISEAGNTTMSAGRAIKSVDTVEVFYQSYKNNTQAYLYFNDTNLSNTYSVTLIDKLNGTTQDMRQNPYYYFTHSTANPENRFQLILNNSAFGIDEPIKTETLVAHVKGDNMIVKSKGFTGPADIIMYDASGRLVTSEHITIDAGSEASFNLPSLATGIYVIDMNFNGGHVVQKIIR